MKKITWNISLSKIKHYAKKHWLCTLLFFSVLTTFFTHIIYKLPAPIDFFEAEFEAGDILSFVGSIIGAIATIYVLQETINSTILLQKEERLFSVRPYFVMDASLLYSENEHEIKLINGFGKMELLGCITGIIHIQNVGVGNAIIEQIVFSRISTVTGEYEERIFKILPAILVGEKYIIKLKCEPGKLEFCMTFTDMERLGRYCAKTEIRIVSNAGRDYIECDTLEITMISTAKTVHLQGGQ